MKSKPFIDIVDRPHIELGGRFLEETVAPVKVYTKAEIAAAKLRPIEPSLPNRPPYHTTTKGERK